MGKGHSTKHLTMLCDNNEVTMQNVKIAKGECKFDTENVQQEIF